jgi:biopolymer transport protein ExbD
LLSAVWLQVSAIPANVEGKGAAKAVVAKPPQRLEIRVTKSALKLRWPAAFAGRPKEFRREAAGTFPWEKLKQTLEPAKAGGKTPVLESASVGGDEGVPYGEIIEALDTAKAAGVPSVAIAMD